MRHLDRAALNVIGRIRSLAEAATVLQDGSALASEARRREIVYDLLGTIELLALIAAAQAENPPEQAPA
mgnify:CR=1 FL=1